MKNSESVAKDTKKEKVDAEQAQEKIDLNSKVGYASKQVSQVNGKSTIKKSPVIQPKKKDEPKEEYGRLAIEKPQKDSLLRHNPVRHNPVRRSPFGRSPFGRSPFGRSLNYESESLLTKQNTLNGVSGDWGTGSVSTISKTQNRTQKKYLKDSHSKESSKKEGSSDSSENSEKKNMRVRIQRAQKKAVSRYEKKGRKLQEEKEIIKIFKSTIKIQTNRPNRTKKSKNQESPDSPIDLKNKNYNKK